MAERITAARGLLLDIDGVLHVGDEPVQGAIEALERLRGRGAGVRLLTNTTSKGRTEIVDRLRAMGFTLDAPEVLTPATLALEHCRERGHQRVMALVSDALRPDLEGLREADAGEPLDAVVLGDLGDGFTAEVLNAAFRALLDGAELVALQHNRYWRSADGLVLDVGAYSAALEYAAEVEATVVGKPSPDFFAQGLAGLGVGADDALMVGDDIEADVGGALAAGIPAVLVRTGKFRAEAAATSDVEPTATIDSIADLEDLLEQPG
jgi:HAD superfamily hydrolase (TIGR01458 family)